MQRITQYLMYVTGGAIFLAILLHWSSASAAPIPEQLNYTPTPYPYHFDELSPQLTARLYLGAAYTAVLGVILTLNLPAYFLSLYLTWAASFRPAGGLQPAEGVAKGKI